MGELKNSMRQEISVAARTAAEAGAILRNTILRDIMLQYKYYVGRLPGSNKTKRLRKKRISVISKWYKKTVR